MPIRPVEVAGRPGNQDIRWLRKICCYRAMWKSQKQWVTENKKTLFHWAL